MQTIGGKLTYSMSEWLEQLKRNGADIPEEKILELKQSDFTKWDRLKKLNHLIGLPIHHFYDFEPEEVIEDTERVQKFFQQFPSPIYSIKAEPKQEFEKSHTRQRKHHATREEVFEFVKNLQPRPSDYMISIWEGFAESHSGNLILSPECSIAEIKKGIHVDLTQGYTTPDELVYTVEFDLRNPSLTFAPLPDSFPQILTEALTCLRVPRNATMPYATVYGHVSGYFEYLYNEAQGFRFFDFNTVLMNNWADIASLFAHQSQRDDAGLEGKVVLKGRSAYPGVVEGRAAVVRGSDELHIVQEGDILIAPITTTEYVPILKKVRGIVCEWGGVTSHPAIIARELKIPTIVGVKGLLGQVRTGDRVEVDADKGIVKIKNKDRRG